MQDEDETLQKAVNEYCDYYYKISTKTIFIAGTVIEFKPIALPANIILRIMLQRKDDTPAFGNSAYRIDRLLHIASLRKAFEELQLNFSGYFSEKQEQEFTQASKKKIPFFKGTVRFYGPTMDIIYLIKEKRKKFWTIKAVEQDLEDYIHDSLEASRQ